MKSFGQLLNEYLREVGVSDSELARALGVSRQTIFRWREGLTARPRRREDVLAIADKLRLTDEERDALLLAAGFRPVQAVAADESSTVATLAPEVTSDPSDEQSAYGSGRLLRWLWVAGVVLVLLAAGLAARGMLLDSVGKATPPATADAFAGATPGVTAVPGQRLVLLASPAGDEIGVALASQLSAALERELAANRLIGVQVAVQADSASDLVSALRAARDLGASVLVLIRQGVGDQASVQVVYPAGDALAPVEIQIDADRPLQLRALALLALGQPALQPDDPDQALALLGLARSALFDDATAAEGLSSAVDGLFCVSATYAGRPELALPACEQALRPSPQMAIQAAHGVALALAGDREGALTSLAAYADWLAGQGKPAELERCNRWLSELEAGGAPFSPTVLAELWAELAR